MTDYQLPNNSADLTGRVALITGASSGLGARFAQVLAAQGAAVVLAARRLDRLEALADQIKAAGGQALAVQMDATDTASLIGAVAAGEAAFGTIDILVNNAGVPDAQRAHKMSTELIDQVLGVNLRGPWILACEVARRLIAAQQPGRIVNISSVVILCARLASGIPALLTRMSIVPNAASPAATAATRLSASVASICTAKACPPALRICAASASNRSSRRAASTTAAPCAASTCAKRAPRPEEAPVTSATRPVRSAELLGN